jgi:hypothetical protein
MACTWYKKVQSTQYLRILNSQLPQFPAPVSKIAQLSIYVSAEACDVEHSRHEGQVSLFDTRIRCVRQPGYTF